MTLTHWLSLSKKLRDCGITQGIDVLAMLKLLNARSLEEIESTIEEIWYSIIVIC